jgi:hypothetical protein
VQCILDTSGYTNALRVCKNYCFSTATMVAWTRLIVTLYHMACFICTNNWPSGHKNCPCSQELPLFTRTATVHKNCPCSQELPLFTRTAPVHKNCPCSQELTFRVSP